MNVLIYNSEENIVRSFKNFISESQKPSKPNVTVQDAEEIIDGVLSYMEDLIGSVTDPEIDLKREKVTVGIGDMKEEDIPEEIDGVVSIQDPSSDGSIDYKVSLFLNDIENGIARYVIMDVDLHNNTLRRPEKEKDL